MNEWVMSSWYSNDLLFTSLSNLEHQHVSDDVSRMFEILWMNNEQYWIDSTILLILRFISRLGRYELNKSIYLLRG